MIDDATAREMLKNIALSGSADSATAVIKPLINGNLNHVLNLSSGAARLQTNVIKRFSLILSQPDALIGLNPFEIRCAFCKRVISYPAWYYRIAYAVNVFHYFVCFDEKSPNCVNVHCYRRS